MIEIVAGCFVEEDTYKAWKQEEHINHINQLMNEADYYNDTETVTSCVEALRELEGENNG